MTRSLSEIFGDFSSVEESLSSEKKSSSTLERYSKHKQASFQIAQTYRKTNLFNAEEMASSISQCGKRMIAAMNQKTGSIKIVNALFCQKRLCSLCAFRRSLKNFSNIAQIVAEPEYENLQWVFITLTIKNCKADELKATITRLLSAFRKMTASKNTAFRKAFLGWFRSLEVTYNAKTREFHPHLHILACVEDDYFHSDKFFKTEEMVQHWKKFLNKAQYKKDEFTIEKVIKGGHRMQKTETLKKKVEIKLTFPPIDYDPVCYIEKVHGKKYKQIAEVAKYTVKPVDYSKNPFVLETLTEALNRVRCSALGGLMKQTAQRLKISEDENDLLDGNENETFESEIKNPDILLVVLSWNIGAKCYDVRPIQNEEDLILN